MGKRIIKNSTTTDGLEMGENKRSLSISRCRAILGEEYKNLTDQQVDAIRIQMEMLADMTIKSYLAKRPVRK